MNEFFNWLSSHRDDEIVGLAGRCFDSPLARWLSTAAGCLIGVDGTRYGWALADTCRWHILPRWAQMFTALSERFFDVPLTAYETVCLLVQIETALTPVVSAV